MCELQYSKKLRCAESNMLMYLGEAADTGTVVRAVRGDFVMPPYLGSRPLNLRNLKEDKAILIRFKIITKHFKKCLFNNKHHLVR